MREGFDNRNRRSIRLAGYDYSRAGYYFVTVCVNERRNLFGDIDGGEMTLNDAGIMVENNWNKLKQRFQFVDLDEFIVMPNHLHGVIVIVGAPLVGAQNGDVIADDDGATTRVAPTLGDIIGAFKSITTNEYIRNVKNGNWSPFDKYFWQRNYYEHVIRDDNDLNRIREYIVNNPVLFSLFLRLNKQEKIELVTICHRFKSMKHSTFLPYVFTEYGVAMLASGRFYSS